MIATLMMVLFLSTTQPLPGGYTAASVSDASVQRAAKTAVAARAKKTHRKLRLVKVDSAATQVVAGTNYQLELRVRRGGAVQCATATVYEDLSGKRELVEWSIHKCVSR